MTSNDEIVERYIRLKYPNFNIRDDITIQDVAEVVLMLSQEVTDLKKRIQSLEEKQ